MQYIEDKVYTEIIIFVVQLETNVDISRFNKSK